MCQNTTIDNLSPHIFGCRVTVGTPSPHSLTLAGGEEEGERKKKLRKSTHGSGAA